MEARRALGLGAFASVAQLWPCLIASGLLASPWRLQTALLAAVSWPSDLCLPELSVQGQQATMLPAPFRAARWFSFWKGILFPLYIASRFVISSPAGKLCSIA